MAQKRKSVTVSFSKKLQQWLAWTPRGLHIVRNIPPMLEEGRTYRGKVAA